MKKMRESRDRQRAVGARSRIEVSSSYGFIPVSDFQMLMKSGPGHVRCAVEVAGGFKVGVGLHHQESLWTMMFIDNIEISSESREGVEESLERWKYALKRK